MWGERVADRYIEKFQSAFTLLADSPQLLRLADGSEDWLSLYRVEQHWLICTIIEEAIYVLTVLRGAMDIPSRLGKEAPQLLQEAELMHRKIQGERGR
jgi:plasmid stabilization system protein ParE